MFKNYEKIWEAAKRHVEETSLNDSLSEYTQQAMVIFLNYMIELEGLYTVHDKEYTTAKMAKIIGVSRQYLITKVGKGLHPYKDSKGKYIWSYVEVMAWRQRLLDRKG